MRTNPAEGAGEKKELRKEEEAAFRTHLANAYKLREEGYEEDARKIFTDVANTAADFGGYDDILDEANEALAHPPTVH